MVRRRPLTTSGSTELTTRQRARKPRAKCDPKLVAAARELRDRWLEQVSADPTALLSAGKYKVSKALPSRGGIRPAALLAFIPSVAA